MNWLAYDLFKKYNCATFHVGENMGRQSYELLGIKHDYFADRGTEFTIEDNGRFKETKNERTDIVSKYLACVM